MNVKELAERLLSDESDLFTWSEARIVASAVLALWPVYEAAKLSAASLDHLMAFKGSRLEETQRSGHMQTLFRLREALAHAEKELGKLPPLGLIDVSPRSRGK